MPVSIATELPGPVRVKVIGSPDTGPAGALTRLSVVLTVSGPTRAVAGTFRVERVVAAFTTLNGALAVSGTRFPLGSAKKPAGFKKEACAVNVPAVGKVTDTVAAPLTSVVPLCGPGAPDPLKEKVTV